MSLVTYINPNTKAKVQIEPDNQDHISRMVECGFVPYIEPIQTEVIDTVERSIIDLLDDNTYTHESANSEEHYPIAALIPTPRQVDVVLPPNTENSLAPFPDEVFSWTYLKNNTLPQVKEIAKKLGIKTPQPPHKDAFIRAILDKYEGR